MIYFYENKKQNLYAINSNKKLEEFQNLKADVSFYTSSKGNWLNCGSMFGESSVDQEQIFTFNSNKYLNFLKSCCDKIGSQCSNIIDEIKSKHSTLSKGYNRTTSVEKNVEDIKSTSKRSNSLDNSKNSNEEKDANNFAAAILVPLWMLEPLVTSNRWSTDKFCKVFNVNPSVIGMQLEKLI